MENKHYSTRIRMTQEEKELILKKANELNMNLSEYLRFVGIKAEVEVKIKE